MGLVTGTFSGGETFGPYKNIDIKKEGQMEKVCEKCNGSLTLSGFQEYYCKQCGRFFEEDYDGQLIPLRNLNINLTLAQVFWGLVIAVLLIVLTAKGQAETLPISTPVKLTINSVNSNSINYTKPKEIKKESRINKLKLGKWYWKAVAVGAGFGVTYLKTRQTNQKQKPIIITVGQTTLTWVDCTTPGCN